LTCGASGRASFLVRGEAVPQGSTRAFIPKGWSRPVITTTAKGLGAWRRLVADQAQAHAPPVPWDVGVSVRLTFYLPRPKSEPKRRRTYPARRPDIDKCARAVLDALTSVFWDDDSRVLVLHAEKRWANDPFGNEGDPGVYGRSIISTMIPPGVLIEAWPIEEGETRGRA